MQAKNNEKKMLKSNRIQLATMFNFGIKSMVLCQNGVLPELHREKGLPGRNKVVARLYSRHLYEYVCNMQGFRVNIITHNNI